MGSLARYLKQHSTALRALIVVLGLAFALNGVAYFAHQHAASKADSLTTPAELCGYCAAYGGFAGASAALPKFPSPAPLPILLVLLVAAPQLRRHLTASRPRAPPAR